MEVSIYDLMEAVEPAVEHYYQKVLLAEVALMKLLLVPNAGSAANGNDLKNDQDPVALMVELGLGQI